MQERHHIAVIGAGVAGLACAQALQDAGIAVTVFDKGRGPGGRLSTRRVSTALGEASFDHGAQYITARDERFARALNRLADKGFVAPWTGRLMGDAGQGPSALPAEDRWVGTPGMNGLVRGMAAGFDVQWGTRVDTIARSGEGWHVQGDYKASFGHYDAVMLAVPAEQAAPLLEPVAPALARHATAAVTAPCWAAMLAFATALDPGFDGLKLSHHPILGWVARNSSKPGRKGPEAWVVHATPAWSQAHLEWDAEAVATELAEAFGSLIGGQAEPIHCSAHRWRFAQTTTPASVPFGWDAANGLGTCGDWHQGARVELAWLSGTMLGQAVTKALSTVP